MSTVAPDKEIASTTQENKELKALQQRSFETTSVINPQSLQEYINIAKQMAGSGFWTEAKTAQQMVALMILGRHFGLSPVQSLTGIHVVKGKPSLHYSVMLAKVREHPDYDYEIVEETTKVAKIQFYRKGKACGLSVFTIEQATKAGTQNLDKMPEVMLIARATSRGIRKYAPDVLNGMPVYAQGEIEEDGAFTDAGGSKRDVLNAELQAKAAQAGAIDAESIDRTDEIDQTEYQPEEYDGPKVRDGQGVLAD
jgi:hypothetical protein